ncbi:unnamed protein product [Adineta ricciae]|uniref:Alpha/beta hydrolase fold-3 domain-containing protein n=1 Tax=Adineta ricciae TaxID=249248 RepID=A0A814Y4D0_ADIRI|nr:unnamed protein product [Adineta ricciae]
MQKGTFSIVKKLFLFVALLAVAIPIRYGTMDYQHLTLRCLHSILIVKHQLLTDHLRPTLSAEYRAFENLIRLKPVAKIDSSADPVAVVQELRDNFAFDVIIPMPSQCQLDKEVFQYNGQSVDAFWVQHHQHKLQKNSDKILIYVHGGGFVAGNIQKYGGFVCHLSRAFNITVLFVEYHLSPEHQYPAGVEDTITVYRKLLQDNVSPSQLIVMGDSAGGGLTLLTIQGLINRQLPVPRGVMVLSPWADLSTSGESYKRNRDTDIVADIDNFRWILSLLLGSDHSSDSYVDPKLSPLHGSFRGFPSMYINVGTAELLEDDSRQVARKAQKAGVNVTIELGAHLMHDYPMFFSYFPEAQTTLNNMKRWVQTVFTK